MGIFIYAKQFLDNFSLKSQQEERYPNTNLKKTKSHKLSENKSVKSFSSYSQYFMNDIPCIRVVIFVLIHFFINAFFVPVQ